MKRFLVALLFLFPVFIFAQITPISLSKAIARPPMISESPVHPADKEEISHTQIMFDYPAFKNAVTYVVTIYKITGTDKKDSVPVVSQRDSTTATLVEGLEFGQQYSWYYSACDKNGKEFSRSNIFTFHILALLHNYRLNVVKNDPKNQGGLVAFDYAQTIFDRKGNPVWFLPPIANEYSDGDLVRDLRVNAQGTLTFISTRGIYETTVDGKILWKGPDINRITKGTNDFYHHGFERLPNGNYMTMGTRHKTLAVPGDTAHLVVEFGTLVEFDRSGKVIWSWNSETYLSNTDLFTNQLPDGKIDADAHLNAFHQDDSAKYIYAGFRNLNRVVKIDKKTGKVVESYGGTASNVGGRNGYFWHQHDINLLPDGTFAVFNNDSVADAKISSSVIVFSQPNKVGEAPKILWKFSCKYDTLADGKGEKGGNVDLLPNGNFLIDMGTLNRCVEVNRKKQIFWDAFVERWSEADKKWQPVREYRAHYVSSLYPCYFTASALTDTLSKNPNQVKVIVNNEGSEADSYWVDYKMANETYSAPISTSTVMAGRKTSVSFSTDQSIAEVRIHSVTNPDFVRIVKLN